VVASAVGNAAAKPLDRTRFLDKLYGMEEAEIFVTLEQQKPAVLISVAEAARKLGLDAFTVYSFIQRDRLSPILDGDGESVVSEDEVAALAQPKRSDRPC
jgi:hypothetical protein